VNSPVTRPVSWTGAAGGPFSVFYENLEPPAWVGGPCGSLKKVGPAISENKSTVRNEKRPAPYGIIRGWTMGEASPTRKRQRVQCVKKGGKTRFRNLKTQLGEGKNEREGIVAVGGSPGGRPKTGKGANTPF